MASQAPKGTDLGTVGSVLWLRSLCYTISSKSEGTESNTTIHTLWVFLLDSAHRARSLRFCLSRPSVQPGAGSAQVTSKAVVQPRRNLLGLLSPHPARLSLGVASSKASVFTPKEEIVHGCRMSSVEFNTPGLEMWRLRSWEGSCTLCLQEISWRKAPSRPEIFWSLDPANALSVGWGKEEAEGTARALEGKVSREMRKREKESRQGLIHGYSPPACCARQDSGTSDTAARIGWIWLCRC